MVFCCPICRTFPTNESLICSKSRRIRLRGFNLWILVTGEPSVENGLGGKLPCFNARTTMKTTAIGYGSGRRSRRWRSGTTERKRWVKILLVWWFQIFCFFHPENWRRFPFWRIFFKGVETTNYIGTDSLLQNSSISGIFKQFFRSATSTTLESWVIN